MDVDRTSYLCSHEIFEFLSYRMGRVVGTSLEKNSVERIMDWEQDNMLIAPISDGDTVGTPDFCVVVL